MTKASFIIPFYNDIYSAIETAKTAITSTKVLLEIIFVDDGSSEGYDPKIFYEYGRLLVLEENYGVGYAFDMGVSEAQHEIIFLSGADIRFKYNQDWANILIDKLEPNSISCVTCLSLTPTKKDIYRENITKRYGADLLFYVDNKDVKNKPDNYRDIIAAKWLGYKDLKVKNGDKYEIPCILGAFYVTTRSWYKYIKGFAAHKKWGCLEPYISLKTWLAGGKCFVVPEVEVGHIFNRKPNRNTPVHYVLYNKMMAAVTCFSRAEEKKFIEYLGTNDIIHKAKIELMNNQAQLDYLYNYYKSIFKITPKEYLEIFK